MTKPVSHKRHCIPPQGIARAVWLTFRFSVNLRLIEGKLFKRSKVSLALSGR